MSFNDSRSLGIISLSFLTSSLVLSLLTDSVTPFSAASTVIGTINGIASLIVGKVGLANGTSVGICITIDDDIGPRLGSMEAGAFVGVSSVGGHDSFQML